MNVEILRTIELIMVVIASLFVIIMGIIDIIKSNKYWEEMYAHLELMKTSLKKEHDLLKRVQEYGEWLDTYHALMHTNVKLEDNEFNNGTLTAAGDCLGEFLNTIGEYVDESRNNEQDK